MARLRFPDAASVDRVQATAGTALLSASGAAARIYLDAAGTQLADILNGDGTANATATLLLDDLSRLPEFQGPTSGQQVLYARVDGGAPLPLHATIDARLDAQDVLLDERFADQTADVEAALAAQAAEFGATYPARASGTTATAAPLARVNVKDHGALGGADSTAAFVAAEAEARALGIPLYIPREPGNAAYQLTATGGVVVPVTGSLRVMGEGALEMGNPAVSSRVFGVTSTDSTAKVQIEGITARGSSRYQLVSVDASADIGTFRVKDVTTECQAVYMVGRVRDLVDYDGFVLGEGLTSASTGSPNAAISPAGLPPEQVRVTDCVVRQGSTSTYECFFVSGLQGSRSVLLDNLTAIDLSPAGGYRDGFDLDGVGEFARISNILCVGTGFEYKTGTSYRKARDAVMSNLVSINAKGAAYSFRSSVAAQNVLAFNPAGWAFFCNGFDAADADKDKVDVRLKNFTAINNGATGFKGMGLAMSAQVDGYTCRPEAGTTHRTTDAFSCLAPVARLHLKNVNLDTVTNDAVHINPTTGTVGRVVLEDLVVNDATRYAAYLANVTSTSIIRPVFSAIGGSRPVFAATALPYVEIQSDDMTQFATLLTSGTRPDVVRLNGVPRFTNLAAATAPPTSGYGTGIGTFATNQGDGTGWLRVSGSSTPATAWKQITTAP